MPTLDANNRDADGTLWTNIDGNWCIKGGNEGAPLLARMAASQAAKQAADDAENTKRTQLTAVLAALDAGTATSNQVQQILARLIRRVLG